MSDEKEKTTVIPSMVGSVPRSGRAKIAQGLREGAHLDSSFYVDATKRINELQTAFGKKGHNILENAKKEAKAKRAKTRNTKKSRSK